MGDLKYVIGKKGGMIFAPEILHIEAAPPMGGLDAVEAAGFCTIEFNRNELRFEVSPYGESTTLGKGSRPDKDKQILEELLNLALLKPEPQKP